MHDLSLIFRMHSPKRLAPFIATKHQRKPIRPLVIHYIIYPSGRIKTTIETDAINILSNKIIIIVISNIAILTIILYHMINFFDNIV
mgnify:CR=1 FL=1